ncbi:MAG: DUF72 domain-containing protein [Chitinophagaceae bacterium]|nr:DUF72 domain-containing protein [Chitinophagaceae bacterium]
MQSEKLFLGTSGLVLPVPNKLAYPEAFRDKSRLCYYANLFNTIEINSSFYQVPMGKTVARWADTVPAGFQFTFKLWKGITHNKGLTHNPEDVKSFMDVIANAGDKKGCLLVQFPASITSEYNARLKELLQAVRTCDKNGDWNLSIEFRHQSWYTKAIYNWLHKRNMNIVYHDIAPVPSDIDSAMDWVYLRFHGPEKGYRGSYTNEFLEKYAARIKSFTAEGKTVFAYFNNTLGEPINNLRTLEHLSGQ